jgi:hypothetical protein
MSTSPFDETIAPGEEVLVRGRNKRSCVSRLIRAHVQGKQYIVLTPAGQIISEDYSNASGAEIRDHMTRAESLGLGKILKDFDVLPTNDEFWELQERGEAEAIALRDIVPSTGLQAVGKQSPTQPASGNIRSPSLGGENRPFTPTASLSRPPARVDTAPAPLSGGLGALAAALGGAVPGATSASAGGGPEEPPQADARVLTVKYDNQGQRLRDFVKQFICAVPQLGPIGP